MRGVARLNSLHIYMRRVTCRFPANESPAAWRRRDFLVPRSDGVRELGPHRNDQLMQGLRWCPDLSAKSFHGWSARDKAIMETELGGRFGILCAETPIHRGARHGTEWERGLGQGGAM